MEMPASPLAEIRLLEMMLPVAPLSVMPSPATLPTALLPGNVRADAVALDEIAVVAGPIMLTPLKPLPEMTFRAAPPIKFPVPPLMTMPLLVLPREERPMP